MKKILCLMLSVLTIFAMSSCGSNKKSVNYAENDKQSENEELPTDSADTSDVTEKDDNDVSPEKGEEDTWIDESEETPLEEPVEEAFDYKELVGVYGEEDADIKLTVFDASAEQGVIFEFDLYDDLDYRISWAMSGIAELEADNTFSFEIDGNGNPGTNTGKIVFSENEAYIEIYTMQINFEENVGSYTLEKTGDVDRSSTYADEYIGIPNHALFEEFLINMHPEWRESWEYLGQMGGCLGSLYSRDLSTDLYSVKDGENTLYYCEYLSDHMDGDNYGVFEVADGKMQLWIPEYDKPFKVYY